MFKEEQPSTPVVFPRSPYRETISRILQLFDSEGAHHAALFALFAAEYLPFGLLAIELLAYKHRRFSDNRLHTQVGGLSFDTPIILAAGWTENGLGVKALYWLGFGGVEVGTVVEHPQYGNPKKRQFIIDPQRSVSLNRMGFNSAGASVVAKNLARYQNRTFPLGANLGINKGVAPADAPAAYARVAECLKSLADYFVINVSSPNTPGLRDLQAQQPLADIIQAVQSALNTSSQSKPLFVKVSPDITLDQLDQIIKVVCDNQLTGIVATNTSNDPSLKAQFGPRWANQAGGIAGNIPAFREKSNMIIRHIYMETQGELEIMGLGGIMDVPTALEKIFLGASILQVLTAFRAVGPSLPGRLSRGLIDWMENVGVTNLSEVRGSQQRFSH